jgi:hypothetical protein
MTWATKAAQIQDEREKACVCHLIEKGVLAIGDTFADVETWMEILEIEDCEDCPFCEDCPV